jgi:hypothetical protein
MTEIMVALFKGFDFDGLSSYQIIKKTLEMRQSRGIPGVVISTPQRDLSPSTPKLSQV